MLPGHMWPSPAGAPHLVQIVGSSLFLGSDNPPESETGNIKHCNICKTIFD